MSCTPHRDTPIVWPCPENPVISTDCPGPAPDSEAHFLGQRFPPTDPSEVDLTPLNTDPEGNVIPDEGGGSGGDGGGGDGGGGGGDGGGGFPILEIPGILTEDGLYISTISLRFMIRVEAA